jgi:tripartite-type tricarboxylate transporter receptor subunit TctC
MSAALASSGCSNAGQAKQEVAMNRPLLITCSVSMYMAMFRGAIDPRLVRSLIHAFTVSLVAMASLVAAVFSRVATAETYPSRPITMIVPFAVGGPTDAIARVLTEQMRGSLGQPIIIENVTGADGSVGTGRAARARPDGYTIELSGISPHVLNGAFYPLPYDVMKDFAPISPLATLRYFLFARATIPATDLDELIDWLKSNPMKASVGFGASSLNLAAAFFQKQTGTKFTLVPYRGVAPSVQDLVAGQIDLLFATPDALSLMRAGSIRAYAVTGDTRSALAPDIPTFGEMGLPALSITGWNALFAPKGTPREIIDRLNAATVEALADPAVRSRLANLGMDIYPREQQTPEALGALQKAEIEKWWPLIKEFGIRAE